MRRFFVPAVALFAVLASPVLAAGKDRIYKKGEIKPVEGTIDKADWKEVTYKLDGGASGTLAWEKVNAIEWADAPRMYRDAEVARQKGDMAGAADLFRKAADELKEKPILRAEALFASASAYQQIGNIGDAIAQYEALIKGIPGGRYFKASHQGRVACYIAKNDNKGAADAITAALAEGKTLAVDQEFSLMMQLKEAEVAEKNGELPKANGLYGAVSIGAAGKWPGLAGSAKVGMAKCQMKTNAITAQATFESIVKDPQFKAQRIVLCSAYCGLGDSLFAQAEKDGDMDKMRRAAIAYEQTVTLYFPPEGASTADLEAAMIGGGKAFLILAQKAPADASKARDLYAGQARALAVNLLDQFPSSPLKGQADEIRKAADSELEKSKPK